jgi:hypothetical protein
MILRGYPSLESYRIITHLNLTKRRIDILAISPGGTGPVDLEVSVCHDTCLFRAPMGCYSSNMLLRQSQGVFRTSWSSSWPLVLGPIFMGHESIPESVRQGLQTTHSLHTTGNNQKIYAGRRLTPSRTLWGDSYIIFGKTPGEVGS